MIWTPTHNLPYLPPPSSLLPPPEALTLNKELEFAAIQAVLRHLDDNHDGSVDLQESEEVGHCTSSPANMSYTHTGSERKYSMLCLFSENKVRIRQCLMSQCLQNL